MEIAGDEIVDQERGFEDGIAQDLDGGTSGGGDFFVHELVETLGVALDDSKKDIFLAFKIEVNGALADAEVACNVVYARAFKAIARKELVCGLQY